MNEDTTNYSTLVGDAGALPSSLVDMLSSMVGSTSPLTESNPSATSSEKGGASADARDTFTTAAKATLEHPSSYLNTPLNANELNASNETDPLTFLPSMMDQEGSSGDWQDFPNHGQSQQHFSVDPNASTSSSGLPSAAAHLQPQQPQQDNVSHTTTASLFGQKVHVTGKRPADDTNTRRYSRSPSQQQNLETNHPVEESVTATTRHTNTSKMPPHKAMNPQNKKKEPRKRIRHLTERKRVERNSKEQERSHQINHQFAELRQLLSANGIVVPKGTKSAVLEITLEYIRVLRERQQQLERNNDWLAQEVQGIARGRAGDDAARALKHAAVKNGVKAALSLTRKVPTLVPNDDDKDDPKSTIMVPAATNNGINVISSDAFEHAPVGTAIASMGGSILDGNACFRRTCKCTREELCKLTVFNLIARDDLDDAFSQLSEMMTPEDEDCTKGKELVFRSAFCKNTGMRISFINDSEGKKHLICVTLQGWGA